LLVELVSIDKNPHAATYQALISEYYLLLHGFESEDELCPRKTQAVVV